MLGFYNYTTLLTYLSLMSAGLGIVISLGGTGHPYVGMCFLLFCGLCDAFDGKVARTKPDRTPEECSFGVQIDSLSDIVAFGVLPVCIGAALMKKDLFVAIRHEPLIGKVTVVLLATVMAFYLLTGMIRLAYFNVTEEQRQKTEAGTRKFYYGLPITSASLIFPTILVINYLLTTFASIDITPVYFAVMALCAIAFVTKFQLKKPGLRGILIMVGIGIVEFVILLLSFILM